MVELDGTTIMKADYLDDAVAELDSTAIKKANHRDNAVDVLKAIAVFGVIVIHTCSGGYANPIGSFEWISSVFWGSITRAGVPIFLMCSGALLLMPQKELSLKKLFFHNILRIVAAMLAWGMAYKCYHLIVSNTFSFENLVQAAKEVLLFKQEFHFYYLHIILLVYLFLPITRVFVCHANKRQLQYALAIWFVAGILYPTVKSFRPFNLLSGIPSQWLMNMTYASIGYGVLGYYIKTYPARKKTMYFVSFFVGFAFVFGGTWFMSVRKQILYETFLEGMTVGVLLMAAGLFGMCVLKCKKQKDKEAAKGAFLSKGSFCIYLMHVFFLYVFPALGLTVGTLPCIVSIPLISLLNLLACVIVYLILHKIPIINRWMI